MTLRTVVAAPFKREGRDRLAESAFVVAVSLDRDWFSPDQAKRLVDVGVGEGLLSREDGDLVVQFDPAGVDVPDGFAPDEALLRERSAFERVLGALVDAGYEKQEAVANINALQADLDVTVEAAAVLYARRQGIDVGAEAEQAMSEL